MEIKLDNLLFDRDCEFDRQLKKYFISEAEVQSFKSQLPSIITPVLQKYRDDILGLQEKATLALQIFKWFRLLHPLTHTTFSSASVNDRIDLILKIPSLSQVQDIKEKLISEINLSCDLF